MNEETIQALRHAGMALLEIADHVDKDQRVRLKACAAIVSMAIAEAESELSDGSD